MEQLDIKRRPQQRFHITNEEQVRQKPDELLRLRPCQFKRLLRSVVRGWRLWGRARPKVVGIVQQVWILRLSPPQHIEEFRDSVTPIQVEDKLSCHIQHASGGNLGSQVEVQMQLA